MDGKKVCRTPDHAAVILNADSNQSQRTIKLKERWKKVVGWPKYSVSDLGRIHRDELDGHKKPCMLPIRYHKGYVCVTIRGKHSLTLVHRLVLEAFVGPCPAGMETRHLDDVKTNNKLKNLRWDTHKNNVLDIIKYQGAIFNNANRSKKERSTIALKAMATRRAKGQKIGYGALTKKERAAAFAKGVATKIANGTPMGFSALSPEMQKVAKEKMSKSMKANHEQKRLNGILTGMARLSAARRKIIGRKISKTLTGRSLSKDHILALKKGAKNRNRTNER